MPRELLIVSVSKHRPNATDPRHTSLSKKKTVRPRTMNPDPRKTLNRQVAGGGLLTSCKLWRTARRVTWVRLAESDRERLALSLALLLEPLHQYAAFDGLAIPAVRLIAEVMLIQVLRWWTGAAHHSWCWHQTKIGVNFFLL